MAWLSLVVLYAASLATPMANEYKTQFALSAQERRTGLMGQHDLDYSSCLVFPYNPPNHANLWMYQVFVDLDVALLNAKQTILEIVRLKAYPDQCMRGDRAIPFFQSHAFRSEQTVSYAIEAKQGFFTYHGYQVGDTFIFTSPRD